ncbi:MAG TPA: hypothetical protein VGK74_24695 [Symbiobacteriaceae bacterium]|jgi:hypothetical protein
MNASERTSLMEQCNKLAQKREWRQIDSLCEQVLLDKDLPGCEKADWMRQWASWIFQESLTNGRSTDQAVSLLSEAAKLAQADPRLLARVYVEQTAILWGKDVQKAARKFWSLLAKYQELKDRTDWQGFVHYNVAMSWVALDQHAKAVSAFRRATRYLAGRMKGWALNNYAQSCLVTGKIKSAERSLNQAKDLLAPEDRHMYASTQAHLAVAKGYPKRAWAIVDETLADPECPPLSKAYLWYVDALVYHGLGKDDQAQERIERSERYASDLRFGLVLDRLKELRQAIAEKRGAS